jgi:hypothetical protein
LTSRGAAVDYTCYSVGKAQMQTATSSRDRTVYAESPSLTKENRSLDNAQVIDATELARRWSLPESWIRDQTRSRATDPIPHIRFGRYVRFLWGDPSLGRWLERRKSSCKQ